jgi:hypothetical protein
MEFAEAAEALGPAGVGPQHADGRESPEQDGHEAGGTREFAPEHGTVQRG